MTYMPTSALLLSEAIVGLSVATNGYPLAVANEPMVTEIPSDKYRVIWPIPVKIQVEDGDIIATFADAGISMSGLTEADAIDGLAEQIAAVVEHYKEAAALGPWAAKQLGELEKYIGERRKPA